MARALPGLTSTRAHARRPAPPPVLSSESCDKYLQHVAPALHDSLHSILGWGDHLPAQLPDEVEVDRAASALIRQAHQQSWMFNALVDVWRTLPGTMRIDVAPVVFAEMVDRALWAAQPAGHAAAVRVARQVEPSASQLVAGDAKRLTQAFLMLICHVMASTDAEGVVVVHASCAHGVADLCVGGVAGHGPRVAAADARRCSGRVIDRAASASADLARRGPGLSFVSDIVALHHGEIVAQGPDAAGSTTFHVRVPLATAVSGDMA